MSVFFFSLWDSELYDYHYKLFHFTSLAHHQAVY